MIDEALLEKLIEENKVKQTEQLETILSEM